MKKHYAIAIALICFSIISVPLIWAGIDEDYAFSALLFCVGLGFLLLGPIDKEDKSK